MNHVQPSYEELERRCREAEAMLEAFRSGRVETIAGEGETILGRLAEVEERSAHIKQVLLAIRNVNQLIVQENDPQRLIERACGLLTETMGYFNAWIALLDEAGKAVCSTASAGFDGGFETLRGGLERGEFPPCMTWALDQNAPVVVEDPPTGCPGCPVAREYGGRAGLAHRLAFGDRIFGVLVVSVPAAYVHDDEEQSLFQEVANDLAFALHKIDAEARHLAERRQAERDLRTAYSKLQAIWSVASLPDASVKNVADHILASIVRMMESQYGFYGFVNDDESVMTIHAWSGEAMTDCSLVDKPQSFPVCKAGIWAEAMRRREPLILNDYSDAHEAKKGLPQGHVSLHNLLVVPFFTHGKITAVAAVANRPADYTTEDAEQLTSFLTSVQAISEGKRAEEALRDQNRLLEAIRVAQTLSLTHDDERKTFKHLLDTLVNLTGSEYGFLDEVCRDPHGEMYKLSLALSDISWDESSRRLYEGLVARQLEFRNLKNLAGIPATTGRLVIANDPGRDDRSGRLPPGHPPLRAFMGIPLYFGGELVGVAGVANRPGGYDENIAAFLEPFVNACAAIIHAKRANQHKQKLAEALQKSEARFRNLFEHAPVAIWVEDFSAGMAYLNELRAAGIHDFRSYLTEHPDELEYLAQRATLREANQESVAVFKVQAIEDLKIPLPSIFLEDSWGAFREIVIALAEGQRFFEIEMPVRNMADERVELYVRLSVAPGHEDTLSRLFISFIDITERKRIEDTLRKVRYSVDHLADSMFWIDERGAFMDVNEAACRNLGYSRAELLTMCVADIDPHFPAERWSLHWEEMLRRGVMVIETEHRTKSGELRPMELTIHNQQFGNARYNCVLGRDITERKQAEQALRRSEGVMRSMIDAITESAFLMDPRGIVLACNQTTADRLGLRPADLIGKSIYEFIPPEVAAKRRVHVETVIASGRPVRFEDEHQGRSFHHSVYPVLDDKGQVSALTVVGRDMTEYKEADSRLRLQSLVLDQITDRVTVTDLEGVVTYVNDAVVKALGYAREELIGAPTEKYGEDSALGATQHQILEETLRNDHWRGEVVNQTIDGRERIMDCRTQVVRDEQGRKIALCGISTDITERRQAEEALIESSRKLQEAIRAGNVGLWDWDLATNRVRYSAEWKRQIGYEEHEIRDELEEWETRVHPEDLPSTLERIRQAIADTLENYCVEFRLRHKDGSYRWIMAQASVFFDKLGKPFRVVGSHVDITERKRVEQSLVDSVRQWQRTFDAVSDSVWLLDRESRIIRCNKAGDSLISREVGEILGHHCWELVHGTAGPIAECPVFRMRETLRRESVEMPLGDRWCEVTVDPILDEAGTLAGAVHVVSDITERKRAELALRESEERLRLALKATNDVVWDWDVVRDMQRWNEAGRVVFGWADIVEHFVSANWWVERVHPEDRQRVEEGFFAVLNNPERNHWQDEYRFRKADGSYAQVLDRGYVLRDAQGKAVRMIGAMLDITERRQAELALRESEERYRRIVDTAQEGIWVIDAERRTTFVNPRMAEMLGFTPEEMVGRSVEDFMFAEDLGDHAQRMSERYQGRPGRYERRFRGKDGRDIWTSLSAVALMDDAGRFAGSFGMFTDITERKEAEAERIGLEEKLRQLQKLDMAGRLAVGFAHDFNNLLSVIQSQMHQVHLVPGLDEPARESLTMIDQATGQAVALTQALRTFGRGLPTQKQVVDLCMVVREAEQFLRHCLPARVQVDIVIKEETCPIFADRAQLQQVLLNLALNARDAMPDGGRLQVTVGKMDTAEFALADEEGSAVPGSVRLSVADTGVGMTPETLERVFEPFFSTKPHDQGTGLGLLIVQGIVKDHEGSIHIESRVNQGTTVHILLPVVSPVIANETASPPRARGNGEGILVAGGNAYLRGTIAAYLDSLNYRAILGGDEAEIVRTWLCHRSEVRLIILSADLRSHETEAGFKAIRAEDPSTPVIILCSKEGGIQVDGDARTIILKEPYRMTDLAGAAAKILTYRVQKG